jgi:hypothetical protein
MNDQERYADAVRDVTKELETYAEFRVRTSVEVEYAFDTAYMRDLFLERIKERVFINSCSVPKELGGTGRPRITIATSLMLHHITSRMRKWLREHGYSISARFDDDKEEI